MNRTTSEPSDGHSRKMVANVAGCGSFCTFRDCHTSIAFTPVGPQPNLAHILGWIWDLFEPKKLFDPPDPRGVPGGILGGQKFKSPGNVMNCPENLFFLNPTSPQGVQMGILGGQQFKSPGNVMDCPENQ